MRRGIFGQVREELGAEGRGQNVGKGDSLVNEGLAGRD